MEVKFTRQDNWLAVGNSIFEGMRDPNIHHICVVLGQTSGIPEVRWGRYEEFVTHVRVSNSPRFVVELGGERLPLFNHMNVTYDEFTRLDDESKCIISGSTRDTVSRESSA